jgi:sulfur-carrier protein adenylyltransferase/sulfurtransferase
MGAGFLKLEFLMTILQISPAQALLEQSAGAILIDVRETDEHAAGIPEAAVAVPRAQLENTPDKFIADKAQRVLLICAGGMRSQMAAENLEKLGYLHLFNIEGGFQRWRSENLPVQINENKNENEDADFFERYARHLRLPQVGVEGQKRLARAKVLLIGAGGLGSPIAYYLAAAGVGQISIIDHDVVDKSNLQRQILHSENDIGTAKVNSAAASLHALNSRVNIITHPFKLSADNVETFVADADVIIDGSDNFPARYLLSDACVKLAKPMVYAAVERFHGQISVFDAGRQRGTKPCYRCLFPEAPSGADAPNCAEAGVLGVLPGVMGVLQATETIKLILQLGNSLAGRLLQFDALAMKFSELQIPVDPMCVACSKTPA